MHLKTFCSFQAAPCHRFPTRPRRDLNTNSIVPLGMIRTFLCAGGVAGIPESLNELCEPAALEQ
jgi:hypothetical protein